jgi:5-methylthioadenosine/S-adenosylhomocysteine deaminase
VGRCWSRATPSRPWALALADPGAEKIDLKGKWILGKRADLAIINPATSTMLLMHDPVANFVNAMREHNVESVMADGWWLRRDRKLLTVDEPVVIAAAIEAADAIRSRVGIKLPQRFPTID